MNTGDGPDSLQLYLTGAAYTGAAQLDASASLGGYRSLARAEALCVHRMAPLSHTVVEYVAGKNGAGIGVLEAVGASSLRWKAPGGSPGPPVTIANGERKVLCDGTDSSAYVIVRRVSPYELGGREVIQLLPYLNNVAGMGNFASPFVGSHNRAVMFYNGSEQIITNVKVWRDPVILTGYIQETPDANGALTLIEDETESPFLTYANKDTESSATTIAGSLAPGAQVGLWLHKGRGFYGVYPVHSTAWNYKWTYAGVTYYGRIEGANRAPSNEALPRYNIWIGVGSAPDSESTDADYTTNNASYSPPIDLPGPQTYYIHVREQNAYGLMSPVREIVLEIDASNAETEVPPQGPILTKAEPRANGTIHVQAIYTPRAEGLTAADIAARRADEWVIYAKGGEAPDPDVDVVMATEAMSGRDGREMLAYTLETAYAEGTPVYVLVRTRRNDGTTEAPVWVESENTDTAVATAAWWGPQRPQGSISLGWVLGVYQSPADAPDEQVIIDADKGVYWEVTSQGTRLYADGVLIWNLRYDGPDMPGNGLYTTFEFREGNVSGTATDLVEFGTWDETAKEIYVSVGGERRMLIDVVAKTITCGGLTQSTAPVGSLASDPVLEHHGETDFQCWNAMDAEYVTGMALVDSGLLLNVDWKQRATEAECL